MSTMHNHYGRLVLATALITSTHLLSTSVQAQQTPAGQPIGIGRAPTAEEIAAWDIDVMPDGTGLPAGSGTVGRGAELFAQKCAGCHGATGREGPNDRLVEPATDTFAFGRDPSLPRTVGNYWPYSTTVYDFINRAMPLQQPGSSAFVAGLDETREAA